MATQQKYPIDVDGSDAMSNVLMVLLNSYPGAGDKKFLFSTLEKASGIGFFPTSGAAITDETEDICGNVHQICSYPFTIVYRAAPKAEAHRLRIKEFLDTLGKWLEQQPISIDGASYKLSEYPTLTSDNRKIKSIRRTSSGHLDAAYQDGIEDWSLSATLKYENSFYR